MTFKDYFSHHAQDYAAYRPRYPAEFVAHLQQLCPSHELALDCGCGTGQLSTLLATHFQHVIATDASSAQIAQAIPLQNLEYRVAKAEQSGLADASVDLITVAQAAHWLNLAVFYDEVRRIAKPNAILALISYGTLCLEDAEMNVHLQHFYHYTLKGYWPKERHYVDEGYQGFDFPFHELSFPVATMQAHWNIEELLGYLKTWSAVQIASEKLQYNPVDALAEVLRPLWGKAEREKCIQWLLSGRIGRIKT